MVFHITFLIINVFLLNKHGYGRHRDKNIKRYLWWWCNHSMVFFFLTSEPPKLQCTRRNETYRKGGNLIEFNEAETRLLKRKNSLASRGYATAQYSRFLRKTFRLPTYLPVVVITLRLIKSGMSPRYNRPLLPFTIPVKVPQKNK